MKTEIFTDGPLEVHSCLLWDDQTGDAAIIDFGARKDSEREHLDMIIRAERLTLRYALQTHMHFDHVYGLPYIYNKYGICPMCHPDDERLYQLAPRMAEAIGLPMRESLPPLGSPLSDGLELQVGSIDIQVIHTPGHSPGGVCFYLPQTGCLFCGDTLFAGGVGRTDLPGGDFDQLKQSVVERLFTLPPETRVLPGHGPVTTIGWERENNPYVSY